MFVSQTVPCDSVIFQPLEDVICQVFIPALTVCPPPCDNLRQLFTLPARHRGLGMLIPTRRSNSEFAASHCIAEPLCLCIHDHSKNFIEALSFQQSIKHSVCKGKLESYYNSFTGLCQQLEPTLQCAMELASMKGASNWLTTLSMVLLYTSLVFRMPCITVGLLSVLPLSVHVGLPFLWIICSRVQRRV